MVQTIKISNAEMNLINDLLNLTGDEIYQKYGYKRDETITHTAKFPNGIEADIICKMLAEEASYAGININEYLKKVGLEPIKYTYSFVDDTENDSTYEYSEMSREEAEEKTMEVMHQFNEDILDYLRNFDKKYDTKFTPIGYREELM